MPDSKSNDTHQSSRKHAEDLLNGSKTVSTREEMVCPVCHQQTVSKHPLAEQQKTKKAKILSGSTCSNPQCRQNGEIIPAEQLQNQFSGRFSTLPVKKVIGFLGVLGIVAAVLLFPESTFGFIEGVISPTVTVSGEITQPNGEVVTTASIMINGQTTETNSSGEYQIEEIPEGDTTFKITSEEHRDIEGEVTLDDPVQITSAYIPDSLYSISGTTLNIQLPSQQTVSTTQSVNGSFEQDLRLMSQNNADTVFVTANPLPESELQANQQEEFEISSEQTLPLDGEITEPIQITASGNVLTDELSTIYTTNSSGQSEVTFDGNIEPNDVSVELDSSAGQQNTIDTLQLSSGQSQNISVDGSVVGDALITIQGTDSETPQTKSGLFNPTTDTLEFTVSDDAAPSSTTLELSGTLSENSVSETGTLTNSESTISVNPSGSLQPKNAQIEFEGGDAIGTTVASETVSVNAQNGRSEQSSSLYTSSESGSYGLSYSAEDIQYDNLVSYGYEVNGTRNTLTTSSGTENLNLGSGDEVDLWMIAEQNIETVDYSSVSNIVVTDLEVLSTTLEEGEDTGVRATVENQGTGAESHTIELYRDGEVQESVEVSLDPGRTETVTFERQSFEFSGVYSLQVNGSDPIPIEVGGETVNSGSGSLSADLVEQSESGTITVDTNSDGSQDCSVSSADGSCVLDLPKNGAEYTIEQNDVNNTNYTVSYTERDGPKDVRADLNGDGTPDIEIDGEFTSGTEQVTSSFPSGTHNVEITTGNNETVEYRLEWTESGVVDSPRLAINGDEVISESESYTGSREYSVNGSSFTSGNNEISLQTNDSAEHTVRIERTEQGTRTFPSLIVNGQQECSSGELASNSCTVSTSSFDGQTNNFYFDGDNVQDIDFEVDYTARYTPQDIQIQQNGSLITSFDRSTASNTSLDGSWSDSGTINSQDIDAEEPIQITTTSNSSQVQGSVKFDYIEEYAQPVNPVVIVETAEGETEEIQITSGMLQEEQEIEIDESSFDTGVNTIVITSENNGRYEAEIVGSEDG